jgi:hypothetical protein
MSTNTKSLAHVFGDMKTGEVSVMKGSQGCGIFIRKIVPTPFGGIKHEVEKYMTHQEAMDMRDFLNKKYPINLSEVELNPEETLEFL